MTHIASFCLVTSHSHLKKEGWWGGLDRSIKTAWYWSSRLFLGHAQAVAEREEKTRPRHSLAHRITPGGVLLIIPPHLGGLLQNIGPDKAMNSETLCFRSV